MIASAQEAPVEGWGRVDHDGIVLVRPFGPSYAEGFVGEVLYDAAVAAMRGRPDRYDFVLVFESNDSTHRNSTSLAFYRASNSDLPGTGTPTRTDENLSANATIYMNKPESWDFLTPERTDRTFCHELGHHWLARARFANGETNSFALLGRSQSHWSYFLNTGNAPLEGNAWVDNGDGTFTTQPERGFGPFFGLDLYLMGLIGAEEVGPMWYIEPDDPFAISASERPDPIAEREPTTVRGRQVDVDIEQVIEALGPVPRVTGRPVHRFLTVLATGPTVLLEEAELEQIQALQARFVEAWRFCTGDRSSVQFLGADDFVPSTIEAPALVPRGAQW
ncbi:MAG: hypothetical protein AAF211_00325 [Myxococcota bacterium]